MIGTVSTELFTEPVLPAAPPVDRSSSERWIELLLVTFVAVGPLVLNSTHSAFFGPHKSADLGNLRYLLGGVEELGALFVLWYVLRRNGRTFSSLGLRATIRGVFSGLGLAIAALAAGAVTRVAFEFIHKLAFGSFVLPPDPSLLFPKASWMVLLPFLTVNAFFEEATVRAFFMTEFSDLTGSMVMAGVASVLIQLSYHSYQGWYGVTGLVGLFTVFSVYYARKRHLFPLYIAHLVIDLVFGLYFLSK